MVGSPCCGKTTFAKRYLEPKGYEILNQSKLQDGVTYAQLIRKAAGEGKSVVIDDLNLSPKTRQSFIKLAQNLGITCRCFYFDEPVHLSTHLHHFRMRKNGDMISAEKHNHVHVSEPTDSEGFKEIKRIYFMPEFDDKNDERLFLHFYF